MSELINEGSAKIKKSKSTFYNPAQKTNRDISVLVISEYFKTKESIRILDAMSATGLRGIRYFKEIPNVKIIFNDISLDSINCIQENLKLNEISNVNVINKNFNIQDVQNNSSKINIINSDCNVLMCSLLNYFDVIDIDPFGSCSEYIENAFRSIKHNGILCLTSTDKGVLCSNENKCIIKYETTILKKFSQNEMAIRALLSCISRHAAKFGISIEPLVSLNIDFYLRIFVRVLKRTPKKVVENNGLFYLCRCGNSLSLTHKLNTFKPEWNTQESSEILSKIKNFLQKTNSITDEYCHNICYICNKKMKICGPFWIQKLHNNLFIEKIINDEKFKQNTKENSIYSDKRLIGILRFLCQEIDSIWYYEVSQLSKFLKICCIKNKDMMTALKNLKYDVSFTHCEINGFKTNAEIKMIFYILELKHEFPNCSLFNTNEEIEKLFKIKFYKGLMSSGLGPLSFPDTT